VPSQSGIREGDKDLPSEGSTLLSRNAALQAQEKPVVYLTRNRNKVSSAFGRDCGLQIDHNHFGLPVLGLPLNSSAQNSSVTILPNTAGQLINSPIYFDPSEESQQFLREHEESTLSQVVGFSKPGDRFVAVSRNPEKIKIALEAIRGSYQRASIELSNDFVFVEDTSLIASVCIAGARILPAIITPEILDITTSSDSERSSAQAIALANISAYTKNGAERWWHLHGLPTPHTHYLNLESVDCQLAAQALQRQFSEYEDIVVNTTGGSGGFALHRMNLRELSGEALQSLFGKSFIQTQGLLDVAASICTIAAIDDDSCKVLGASIQRFDHGFGIHSGNYWNRDLWLRMEIDYPGIWRITNDALESLRRGGVRGQVNIDLMCISETERQRRGLRSRSLLREANIRPAGSSVLLRLREGEIDSQRVEHISSATGIPLDTSESGLASVLSILESCRTVGKTRAVLYSVNPHAQTGSIAFLGTDGCSLSDLITFEERVRRSLSAQ
jgi:hypothetical protein